MRSLLRNQQKVFFKLYGEQTELVNEHGEHTGQHKAVYGPLQWAMLCVSPNKGSSEVEQFGFLEDYDRTMTGYRTHPVQSTRTREKTGLRLWRCNRSTVIHGNFEPPIQRQRAAQTGARRKGNGLAPLWRSAASAPSAAI